AGYHLAKMNADADAQRPARTLVDVIHRDQHVAGRGDRAVRRLLGLERRAEQREESVAEKFVHDAAMAVEDFHQHRERAVEAIDDVLRRTRARRGGKTAKI